MDFSFAPSKLTFIIIEGSRIHFQLNEFFPTRTHNTWSAFVCIVSPCRAFHIPCQHPQSHEAQHKTDYEINVSQNRCPEKGFCRRFFFFVTFDAQTEIKVNLISKSIRSAVKCTRVYPLLNLFECSTFRQKLYALECEHQMKNSCWMSSSTAKWHAMHTTFLATFLTPRAIT